MKSCDLIQSDHCGFPISVVPNPTYQSPGLCTVTFFFVTSVMIFMAIARVNYLFNIDLNRLFNENEHSLVCSPLLIL